MSRIDDVQQQLQQSIDDLQAQINGDVAALRESHDRSNAQLLELFTRLSTQVAQLSNRIIADNGGNSFSRFSRLDFPEFDGDDVGGWVYKCEQFFAIDNTFDGMKVKLAAIHLNGRALLWHNSFMNCQGEGVWPTWDVYKKAILARFDVESFDDPLSELMKLKQEDSVESYKESFDTLLTRVELSEEQAVSCFLSGLIDGIQTPVRMFEPQTLHDAYCLAKLQESTLNSVLENPKSTIETQTHQYSLKKAPNAFNTYQTMRMIGKSGSQSFRILVVSGSAHNFLDAATAAKLNCELKRVPPMWFRSVAKGEKLQCEAVCEGFKWVMNGEEYVTDVYIVTLGSCDMILGVPWLETLGTILWDFKELRMEFTYNGKMHILRGRQ